MRFVAKVMLAAGAVDKVEQAQGLQLLVKENGEAEVMNHDSVEVDQKEQAVLPEGGEEISSTVLEMAQAKGKAKAKASAKASAKGKGKAKASAKTDEATKAAKEEEKKAKKAKAVADAKAKEDCRPLKKKDLRKLCEENDVKVKKTATNSELIDMLVKNDVSCKKDESKSENKDEGKVVDSGEPESGNGAKEGGEQTPVEVIAEPQSKEEVKPVGEETVESSEKSEGDKVPKVDEDKNKNNNNKNNKKQDGTPNPKPAAVNKEKKNADDGSCSGNGDGSC